MHVCAYCSIWTRSVEDDPRLLCGKSICRGIKMSHYVIWYTIDAWYIYKDIQPHISKQSFENHQERLHA